MNRDKMKVALIVPQVVCGVNQVRRVQPPLGLGCIAGVLEQEGIKNILIIDAAVEDYQHIEYIAGFPDLIKYGASENAIVEKLKKFPPDIIGISCLFSSQAQSVFSLAKRIKMSLSNIPIALGGIHASILHEEILNNHQQIDFIIAGEADYTFTDFVIKYINQKEYRDVPGLIYRDAQNIKANQIAAERIDVDSLPLPAWHLMPMEKYFKIAMPHNPFVKSGRVGCIITSRGCPQRCYFCSSSDFFGHGFRPISAMRVVEMVHYLVDCFDIRELQILDDTFTVDYKRVIEICEGIEHLGLRITLPNAVRADMPINHEARLKMFCALQKAGCEQIGVAVEHGDQDFINNVINKHLDLTEAAITCDLAHKAGLLVHTNFMVGFPFETEQQRQKTAYFARNFQADSFSISFATPLPGTRMWDIVKKNNLFVDSFDINRVLYGQVNIVPYDISIDELQKFVENLNLEINRAAAERNPASRGKYKLFKGRTACGDRKYQHSDEES